MKVIKHGNTKTSTIITKHLTCPVCECQFEYGSDELMYNERKEPYVHCPDCGACCIEEEDLLNYVPHFPQDFYTYKNGREIDDATVNKWIEKSIEFFRENPDETETHVGSGDTLLVVLNYVDGMHFYVAKGYYEGDMD